MKLHKKTKELRFCLLSAVGLALAFAGELSAATVSIEMQSGPVSHAFTPEFTVTLSTGSQVTFPAAASDSVEFVSTFSEFDLSGASRLEFFLTAPAHTTFLANPSAGYWTLGFFLDFTSSNPDLVLNGLEASFLGATGGLPIRMFTRTSVLGPAAEFVPLGGSTDRVVGPFEFDGILVTADIDSPLDSGVLTVNSASIGIDSRTLDGNSDPPSALAIVPEPRSLCLLLSTAGLFLLRRRRGRAD